MNTAWIPLGATPDFSRPGIIALGLAVGVLTGLFGVGGGFLLTPCLKFFLGFTYPLAVGCSLAAICCTGAVSAFRHGRHRNVAYVLGSIMAAGALAGTFAGKTLMGWLNTRMTRVVVAGRELPLPNAVIGILFLCLLSAIAAVIVWEQRKADKPAGQDAAPPTDGRRRLAKGPPPHIKLPCREGSFSAWGPFGIGIGVGILTGLLGVGGGFVIFPILVYVIGVPTVMAVGTSAFQIVFASILGTVLYWRQGLVDPRAVAMLVLGAFAGVEIGVRLSMALGGRRLRRYFVLVVAAGIVVVLADLASMLSIF